MAEFTIGAVAYQSRMLDGEAQTLVLKRLLPSFAALMGVHNVLKGSRSSDAADADDAAATSIDKRDTLMPVARELASLSDADVKFVMDACLAVTKRSISVGTGWVDVVQRGVVQDQDDKKFITRLTIAWHVLGENFSEMLQSFGVDLSDIGAAPPA